MAMQQLNIEVDPELAHVEEWREIWDATYLDADPWAGWISSLTGEPYSGDVMREWLDATVDHLGDVTGLAVLEIGAGTGLVTRRLAGKAADWLATDVSAIALERLEQAVSDVHTQRVAAHQIAEVDGQFDLVVLNSVVQYFPSLAYLRDVLTAALRRLAPGGRLFVGDVRSLPLQPAMRSALGEYGRATPDDGAELLVDPRWFLDIAPAAQFPVKQTARWSEMSAFRYDVVLGRERPAVAGWGETLDWERVGDLTALTRLLREDLRLTIRRIPNAANARWLPDVPDGIDLWTLSGVGRKHVLDVNFGVDLDDPTRVMARIAPRIDGAFQVRVRTGVPGSRLGESR